MSSMGVAPAALLAARTSLAIFFVPAAIAKFRDWRGFSEGLRAYAVLPAAAVRVAAIALPVLELLLGLALLAGVAPVLAGLTSAMLLALFTAAMGINLSRGRDIWCNCYGIAATKRIGTPALARNLALVGLALAVASLGAAVAPSEQWSHPSSWGAMATASDGLLVAILTSWTIASVYLLEWSLDTRSKSNSAMTTFSEAP